MPDADERCLTQMGDDGPAKRQKELRVPKHLGYINEKVGKKLFHHLGVMQNFFLQARNRLQLFDSDSMPDSASNGRVGVVAKVMAVLVIDALKQKSDLNSLQIMLLLFLALSCIFVVLVNISSLLSVQPHAHQRDELLHVYRFANVIRSPRFDTFFSIMLHGLRR